jgi:hypothetical protein
MEPFNDSEKDFVRQILDEDVKYGHVDCNFGFVCDAVERSGARAEQLTESVVRRAISDISGKLATNGQYAEAFHQCFMTHPELAVTANELILASQSQALFGAVTAQNLEAVLSDPEIRRKLTFSEAHQARLTADRDAYNLALQQATTTATQGASIILDLTAYLLGPDGLPKGKTRWDKAIIERRLEKETSDLMALTFDELSEKHEAWLYKRRLESMTASEVREIVKADDLKRRSTYTEFLTIPSTYSPPGKPDVKIPWTRELLKRLPDVELRRLFKVFGEAQLNEAVNAAAAQGR